MKPAASPFALTPNPVLSVALQPSEMVAACTWSAVVLDVAWNGVGFVRQNGPATAWELIGLVKSSSKKTGIKENIDNNW